MINKKHASIYLYLIFFLFTSCRGPTESPPLRSPELSGPIITGLVFTDEVGDDYGVWGDPSLPMGPIDYSNENASRGIGDEVYQNRLYQICNPYPNPNNSSITIEFYLNREMSVQIWVVPAYYTDVQNNQYNFGTSIIKSSSGLSIKTILEEKLLTPKKYAVVWNGIDADNLKVQNGFYRIYIEFDKQNLLWRDVLIIGTDRKITPQFETFLKPFWKKYLHGTYPF